jgi:hypothetical protein
MGHEPENQLLEGEIYFHEGLSIGDGEIGCFEAVFSVLCPGLLTLTTIVLLEDLFQPPMYPSHWPCLS